MGYIIRIDNKKDFIMLTGFSIAELMNISEEDLLKTNPEGEGDELNEHAQ